MPPVARPAMRSWRTSDIRRTCNYALLCHASWPGLTRPSTSWPQLGKSWMRGSRPRMTKARAERLPSLPELRQLAGDFLLAVHHLGDEGDAVDVAFVIPGGLDQDAGFVLRRDGQAVQRLGQLLAVELADLLRGQRHRVGAGVALDAIVVRHVFEPRVEFV